MKRDSMAVRKQRIRRDPQVSLNLLGEYMIAGFVRKRSILRDFKFPKAYIGAQYDPTQKAASRYLAGRGGDREWLKREMASLLTGSERSAWYHRRHLICEQAIKCVLDLETQLGLDGLEIELGGNASHRLLLAGVSVVVMPDLIVRGIGRKGPFLGAMKFRYVKTKPVALEWATFCATVLHQIAEAGLARGAIEVDRRQCRFVDVYAGKVFEAPEAFKGRRKEIEAACTEIKLLWPTIEPGGVA